MTRKNNVFFYRSGRADGRRVLLLAATVLIIAVVRVAAAQESGPPVALDPTTAALLEDGRWPEALDRLIPAYQQPGSDPHIRFYIALCYKQIGGKALAENQPAAATDAFQRGRLFAPKDPDLFLGLGRAYLMASDYSAAESALLDAVALRSDDPAAHRHLGYLYYLTDDAESAVYHYEQALQTGGPDPSLTARLARLRRQLAASRRFETVADHQFSVRFDGERDPILREVVLDILGDAVFEVGQRLNIWPNRQIGVMLLTRTAFFNITGSPGWAAGIYEGQIKVPVAGYRRGLLETVLHHEYVHAVLFDFLSNRCPWWLNEGLAQYFSPDTKGNRRKLEIARKILADGTRPSLDGLPRQLAADPEAALAAYSLALSATTYLIDAFDLFSLQSLLEGLRDGMSPDAALQAAIGYAMADFEAEWIASVRGASR